MSETEEESGLRIVDGLDLPVEYREIYLPGQIVTDANGRSKRLPRFFYEVPEKSLAWETQLTPHFALGELLRVDLKEVDVLREYPRHVPCAITVLASYLERLRVVCEAPIYVSVNGGYRSIRHQGNRSVSVHSWGSAVDIYRIGSTFLDDRESIEKYRETALSLGPEVTVYPYGHGPGETDDHLHLDLGFLLLVPSDADDDDRPELGKSEPSDRRNIGTPDVRTVLRRAYCFPRLWKASMGEKKLEKKKLSDVRQAEPGERLLHPAVGMESEFNVLIDGEEINPERYWGTPLAFIDQPLLPRIKSSFQLPTGGAVYFDRGVIEVVTPVIEIAPRCAARVVRSLWEQIAFVRSSLTDWETKNGHDVRLRAYSTHYNVSFELDAEEQSSNRNVKKLALLLAYMLPPPLMVIATNRMSSGVGVRPRGDRIEITLDFTPDPSLMIATATAIIGIVREVMSWPSYSLDELDHLPFPRLSGVVPGKHTSRKGWLTKDIHYPRSPFTTSPDDRVWECVDGSVRSMREIGLQTAEYFRESIRRYSDPFSVRLLFGVLRGREQSLLDLSERPVAYEHVGVLCRWGSILSELILRRSKRPRTLVQEEVTRQTIELRRHFTKTIPEKTGKSVVAEERDKEAPVAQKKNEERPARERRGRRAPSTGKRRRPARRPPSAYPDRDLSRSIYERVFLQLTSGKSLLVGNETWRPSGMESWYRAKFKAESDGRETTMSIDELARHLGDWK